MNWNPIATRRQLGRARQVANEQKVRAMELEAALGDLLFQVMALSPSVYFTPTADGMAALKAGRTLALPVREMQYPKFTAAVEHAQKVMGV